MCARRRGELVYEGTPGAAVKGRARDVASVRVAGDARTVRVACYARTARVAVIAPTPRPLRQSARDPVNCAKHLDRHGAQHRDLALVRLRTEGEAAEGA